jgi:cytochrome c
MMANNQVRASMAMVIGALLSVMICAGTHAAEPKPSAKTTDTPAADKGAFVMCAGCHSSDGSAKAMGPTLKGIVGRKAATDAGYKRYSKALLTSGIAWNNAELDAYLKAPNTRVKGTTMMVGVADVKKRAAIVRYLNTLK